jgi:pSer/pThr/pTyr-binding forkhead associated (FHA) protein
MGGLNGSGPMHAPSPVLPSQGQLAGQQGIPRPMTDGLPAGTQPVLYLLSLNGTFERKTISVPYHPPDTLRIGRQTNAKTLPTPTNGFFDSKVLSRQHAEIWADRQGKIWIRDVKSSNGTFVNGTRLSQENRESEPHELQTGDHLELGIDIVSEDQKTVVHHKVAAKVEHAGLLNPSSNLLDMNFGDLDPANGSLMLAQQSGIPFRGRGNSQASMASNGRMLPGGGIMGPQASGMAHQRGLFFSPISTEQIVKKLQVRHICFEKIPEWTV